MSDKKNIEKKENNIGNVKKQRKNGKLGKLIKWVIILLVIAAAVIFIWKNDTAYSFVQKYVSFLPERNAVAVKNSSYTLSPVQRRTISVTLTGTGTLQPIDSYTITSKVSGEILSADFEEMDIVEKDQVLYVIDSSDIRKNMRDYADNVDDAQEKLDDLNEDYEDLKLYSDYSGICDVLYVEEGDNVQKGASVAHIIDRETMLLEVPFFVQDIPNISIGQSVDVTVNASTDTVMGTVTEIGTLETVTSVGAKLRTVTVSVKNPGGITPSTTAYAVIGGIESAQEGSFKYNVDETITAIYGGEIEALNIEEGSRVEKGALVLSISSESLDDQKKSLEKSLDKARENYNDYLEKLDDYTITAPISGTVVQKNYKQSDNLNMNSNSNSTLAIIYDMSKLTFDMSIDELDLHMIEVGQEVEITSDSFDEAYTGYVKKKSIIGSSMNGTTTYPITIELDGNEALLPGMNVNASIFVEKVENALSVPVDAIMRGNTVRVLKKTADTDAKGTVDESKPSEGDPSQKPEGGYPQMSEGERPQMPEGGFPSRDGNNKNAYGNMAQTNGMNVTEESFEIVSVETGVSDDEYVEIISGLTEGDIVVIEKRIVNGDATTSTMGGMMGGGFGGGMPAGMPSGGMGGMPSGGMSGNRGGMSGGMPGGMRY